MEQEVLSKYNLSWTAFSMLYNLWIWNAMETRSLAKSMGVTVATVSSVANTMEKRDLLQRNIDPNDRRLVILSLTDEGKNVMDELFPDFNRKESEMVAGLSEEELAYLAKMLRRINKNIMSWD
jgi:DNA-binding MarR family transcriptional regulator